jgi:glycosyltransferase involved in cell wall biosynthesis
MNRAFAFGLSNKGIKVKVDNQKSEVNVNDETAKQIEIMGQANVHGTAPKIFGATIPINMFHGGKKILYTMMETACTLHPDYKGKLNLFDEIWVPTNFAKDLFQSNGVHPPIKVMPLGVDTDRYTPERKSFNFKQDLNGFVFLSVFKWGYRKGHDILLKAFMEEFSSSDDITLLLVSRAEAFNHDPNHIVNDFTGIRNGIDKSDEDLPHIALYDNEISEKDMPSIYGSADAFCLISRGEGWGLPYCFLKGTQINTSQGLKNIEDIEVGDSVVTHTGDSKLVNELHKNEVKSSFGKVKTMLGVEISGTANHAFWHVSKPKKKDYKNKGISLCDFLDDVKPQWTRMNEINKGDYLLRPIRKDWNTEVLTLDVRDYCKNKNLVENDGRLCSRYSNGPVTNQKIADLAGVSKRQVGHYKQDGRLSSRAKRQIALVLEKLPVGEQKSYINRYIDVDEKFAKLLGYYCAEGNPLGKMSGVELSFHTKETDYHSEVYELMHECFGIKSRIAKKMNKHVTTVRVCNSLLAQLFVELVGRGSHNKKIPEIILHSSKKVIQAFLNGYINGDGHSNKNIVSITTASESLAREFQSLLLDQGEVCSFNQDNRDLYNCTMSGERSNWIEKDYRVKKKNKRWNVWKNSEYIFIPVKDVEIYEDEQTVYNFDVDDNHSYIANNFAVHNCEAGASGLPVIASNCSGHSDFLNESNSFLVEPDGYATAETNGSLNKLAKHCRFYEDQKFPNFGRDAIEQTKKHMRYVFENYNDEPLEKATKLRDDLVENYTWKMAVDRVHRRVIELNEEN